MELQYNKISELIESQLPNFLQEEGPKFIKFVENYYEWMETSKLEVSATGNLNLTSIPDTLRIKGAGSEKIVYANVLNIYSLDNGNYVFYIKEYNQDLSEVKTRGFSSGNILTFIDDNQIIEDGDTITMEVVSYIQNTSLSSKNLWNLQDIDRTLDEYVDFFMTEYLKGFPLSFPTQSESLDIDVEQFKKFLVKHSREFYQSKGTEDSFKYFFRSIFNKEVTISYPKERVMSSSNNSFESTFTVFLEPISNDIPDITSKKIKGQQSGVEYFVENVSLETVSDYKVLKLELFKTTTISEFDLGETILDDSDQPIGKVYYGGSSLEILNTTDSFSPHQRFFVNRNGELIEYKDIPNSQKGSLLEIMLCDVNSGDLSAINVSNGGSGYSVGQNLVFDNSGCFENEVYQRPIVASVSEVDENGTITKIEVRRVGRGYVKIPKITHIGDVEVTSEVLDIVSLNVGTIKDIKIKNSGFGYSLSEIELDLNNSGQNNIKLNFGSVFDDGGKFLNENSFLSDFKVLQDSSYYQTFSYVVESSLQIYKYKDLLKALIHPAGMKMFGTISSENKEDSRMVSVDSVLKIPFHIEKIINKYSDVPINKIHGNISRVVPYDGGVNSDYTESPVNYETFEGGGPPNEGAISDIADLHIDSVSSWSELHQVYKHKYLNLRAGFHEKSYFKFEEIKGLRASIDLDGKTSSISQTFFVNVTKEDNRDFNDDDFIIGDVIYQGDSYETSISRALIENWNSETGELELLKTQGSLDSNVEFKVNSYTKNILFDDLNSVDSNFLNICKKIKIDSDFDKINAGEIIYQGVDIDNTTFKSEVLGVDYFNDGTQDIKVSIISGELSDDLIKIDILQITTDENAPDVYDTYAFTKLDDYDISIIETRNVLNIGKKIKIDSDFDKINAGEIIYQGVDIDNTTFKSEVLGVDYFNDGTQDIKVSIISGELSDDLIKIDILQITTDENAPDVYDTYAFTKLDESDFIKLEKISYENILSVTLNEEYSLSVDTEVYQEDSEGVITSKGKIVNFISGDLIVSREFGDFSESVLKINTNPEILNLNIGNVKDFEGFDDSEYFVEGELIVQGDFDNSTFSANVTFWDSLNQYLYYDNSFGQVVTDSKINKLFENYILKVNIEGLNSNEFLKNDILYQGDVSNPTFKISVNSWDFSTKIMNFKVESGTINPIKPLKFRKSQSIFDILDVGEKINLSPTPNLLVGDFLYKGQPSNQESYSSVTSVNGSDVTVKTSLGEISEGDQLKTIKKYSISNLHKSFILQDKIDDDGVIYSYGNEFSVGETVYQGDSLENSTFIGVVSYWDSVNKNLELDNTSGLIQNNQKLKKVLSNFNIVQSKELILILNQLEEDFLSNDFIFSQTITQQNNDGETASGEVLDWNHITGVLDLEILRPLDVDIVPKDFEIGYSVSGFNVNQVEKILDIGTSFDGIFDEKFSSGDVIYQGDVTNPTAEATVLDWNNFEGILTIEPTEGLENFDKLDPFKIRFDSTDENFTIDKVINRLTLDKTKIPFTVDDFKSENGKIFQQQTIGQVGEVNLPFESDYVNWDESTGELRIDVTSGVFDSSLLVKQESVNSTLTIQKKLDENDEEIDFDGTEFVVGDTISQLSSSGEFTSVVQSWNQNTGELVILETNTTETLFKINLEVNSYNVTKIIENSVKESIFAVKSTVEKVELDSTYSTNYLKNETVYQEDDSGNIIFEGVIDHLDSGDNKLKLIPTLGSSHISKALKKSVDTFEIEQIREVFIVTDSSQFSIGNIFYQNDYDHSYSVLQVNGDKIYCGYDQDEMLDSNFVILKDGTIYTVNSIQQENLSLYRNINSSSFDNFELNDFVIGETVYQGDISNPTAEATVTNWDISNGELSINLTSGKFIKSESIKNNIEYDDFTIYGEIKTGSIDLIKFGDSLSFVEDLNDVLDDNGLFRVLNVDDLNNEIRLNICSGKKHENSIILKRVSFDG